MHRWKRKVSGKSNLSFKLTLAILNNHFHFLHFIAYTDTSTNVSSTLAYLIVDFLLITFLGFVFIMSCPNNFFPWNKYPWSCCQKSETHHFLSVIRIFPGKIWQTPAPLLLLLQMLKLSQLCCITQQSFIYMKMSQIITSRKGTDAQNGSHAEMACSFRLRVGE